MFVTDDDAEIAFSFYHYARWTIFPYRNHNELYMCTAQ